MWSKPPQNDHASIDEAPTARAEHLADMTGTDHLTDYLERAALIAALQSKAVAPFETLRAPREEAAVLAR